MVFAALPENGKTAGIDLVSTPRSAENFHLTTPEVGVMLIVIIDGLLKITLCTEKYLHHFTRAP